MIEWLDDFYGSDTTRAAVSASIAPVFERYAAEVWKADGGPGKPPADFVESLSDTYVKHHLDSSRAQLQEVLKADDPKAAIQGRITEWIEKRPAKVAANETVRTSNAVALAQMRAAGVTHKVWRTVGTCAFCKEMAGKTTTIEKDFVKPGDALHPEGVAGTMTITQPIGHPPLHQGCVCSVEGADVDTQLGLPEFDAPEFEVPKKLGYVDPQLRPNADPELAAMWDRTAAIHKNLIDRFNIDSGWNGTVRRINKGTAVAEFDGSISINAARLAKETAIREHNLVHEVFHTMSNADEAAFARYAGWEEGLVDQLTILNRQSVWDDIGVKLSAKAKRDLADFDGNSSYGLYRYAWENMRKSTGLLPDDFYGQMLRTPLAGRPALAKKLGVSDFELQRGLQILGGAD